MTALGVSTIGVNAGQVQTVGTKQVARKLKIFLERTAATAGPTDTLEVDLNSYNVTAVFAIRGVTHTLDNDILVIQAPTTSVSGTTLSVVPGGTTYDKTRSFIVFGEGN